MIRIFNHYIPRQTIFQIALDALLLASIVLVMAVLEWRTIANLGPLAPSQILSLAAGTAVIGTATGLYRRSAGMSWPRVAARAVFSLLVALPLVYALFSFTGLDAPDRAMLQWAAMAGVTAVVLRRAYLLATGLQAGRRTRVLVFGAGEPARIVGDTLLRSDPNVEIVGFLPGPNEAAAAVPREQLLASTDALLATVRQLAIDEIVVALTERRSGSMPLRQLLDCKLHGVKVYDLPTHFEKRLGQIRVDFVNASWLIFGDGFNQGAWRNVVKRAFDVVFSLLLLILSAPVMLLTALLIKFDSRGPVLYRQERVGQGGETFMVAKFRSMRTDAEKDGKPRWATAQDDRVTRVGNIIRKLRIDELPQLFNVLRGEMSLVGPRPERPYFVEQLTQKIPYFAARHSVKPGVTGWAQVRYQYGSTVEDAVEKLQYDLYYVKNHSLFLDLVVLFETVGVVLTGKGAR